MQIKDIENKIKSSLHALAKNDEDASLEIEIIDDSHKHQHHIEMRNLRFQNGLEHEGDKQPYQISHLRIKVRCKIFQNMKMVDRHKLMHKILEEEYKAIHSISFDLA